MVHHLEYRYTQLRFSCFREIFPGESEKGAVKINNKLHRIELDSWDRRGANNNLETRMGWSVCSKSFSISCLGDPTRLFSYEKGDEPDYPDEVGENREKSSGLGSNDPEPYSVMYYHEYFSDLADEFTHSWFVGASVMFATNIKLKINTLLEVAGRFHSSLGVSSVLHSIFLNRNFRK